MDISGFCDRVIDAYNYGINRYGDAIDFLKEQNGKIQGQIPKENVTVHSQFEL